jgi:hypothetical protein
MAQSNLYQEAFANFKDAAMAKYSRAEDRQTLVRFLQEKGSPEDARRQAESLKDRADEKYGNFNTWITAILGNISSVIELGDYATTGAPESVGLAWYAVRVTLAAIQNNYDLYNFFGTGLIDISEIMIIIPHYDRLYDERQKPGWTPSDIVEKLFRDIIEIYQAVLDFSLAVKRHLEGRVADKIRHGFKDFFGLQKPKFQEKLAKISELKKKILKGCDAAFQKRALDDLESMQGVVDRTEKAVKKIQDFQPTLQGLHDEQIAKLDVLEKQIVDWMASAKPKTPWELAVQTFERIQAGLKPANDMRSEFRSLASSRYPGTCEWIFEDNTYRQWFGEIGSLLCIGGHEGRFTRLLYYGTTPQKAHRIR